ncbi:MULTISPECIES: LysR family transcriptional regulator [Paenibacillus]|uniref:DNA-binding transcriptional LysR family regulator n=1 Tax=Paenibacillus brasilensis TaxID=128574 RepID=A0ABU0KUZ7_9BACL|nr:MULTISPECIES: LysR family transcriptional regulator [Paenibacillus]MDQ0493215.1 DNA-binding transcriptional LysR family regulator [Paenibacillus brasilensis]
MELTQLQYFLTVARLQHMTSASKALNITQPALSHAISKLENELGIPLFERNGRNVELNRYGRIFSKWVEEALKNLEKGKQEINEWSNPDKGVIHISYLNILGIDLVPALIRDYQITNPSVRFDLTQGNLGDINEHFDKGHSDLMITSRESTVDDHEWIVIRKTPLYIVVSDQHPFANRSSLSLFDLSGEPFVGLKKNCGLKATITSRFENTGFMLDSTFDAEDLPTVAGFIKAGLGVSVLPKTFGLMLDGLVWVPIQEEGWEWEVGLKWRKDRYVSPAAKRFIDYIDQQSN